MVHNRQDHAERDLCGSLNRRQRRSKRLFGHLASIKTEGQLCSMVKTRSSISEEQAKKDVEDWMWGKQF